MITYTLKVLEIRKETEDTITVYFKQPSLRKLRYKAGQYLTLIFRINGRRYVRPYSFSSAPSVDKLIGVTIKRVHNGLVSNHIHDQVKIGDIIEALEPMGDFVYDFNEDINEVYFWGIGSGITPLISLIKDVLSSCKPVNVNLIYGNRNFDTTIFNEAINKLLSDYPLQFKVWHFHTQFLLSVNDPYVIEGRIKEEEAFKILNRMNVLNSMHYICGPIGLKESVKTVLAKLKVPIDHIYSEDFQLIRDPKDFDGVKTQVVNLKFEDHLYTLEVVKGKSILESGLEAGIELPYSCQTGSCSTCKARCLNGSVKMIGLIKEREDLEHNEYLLCCSHPLSEDVYLEI